MFGSRVFMPDNNDRTDYWKVLSLLLQAGVERNATDIHLSPGASPRFRVGGKLIKWIDYPSLTARDTEGMYMQFFSEKFKGKYDYIRESMGKYGAVDFNISVESFSRFRVNCFRQRGSYGFAIRIIPREINTIENLQLPLVLKKIARESKGLFLVTGPAGSGKSTTLAAMIREINECDEKNIITMEDPIEYLHPHKKSLVVQREVPADVSDFGIGLMHALREDPDVIMVGEMRDAQTIMTAARAAETGHFVLSTLHTNNAALTVERMVNAVIGSEYQNQVREQLANTLIGVLSQQTLPKIGGGLCVATELLLVTPAIQNMIREGKAFRIEDALQQGRHKGMHTMEESLSQLVERGQIEREHLTKYVENKNAARFSLHNKIDTFSKEASEFKAQYNASW